MFYNMWQFSKLSISRFLVAVATLEMVLLVGWSVSQSVRMIVKKYSSFNDMMDFLEMTPQHHNNIQTMPQWPQFHNLKFTNAQHDEIQKQLHNMMKFTNNCTTWCNSLTIAQHGEIHPNTQTTLNSQLKLYLNNTL